MRRPTLSRPLAWSLSVLVTVMAACSETTAPDPIDECAGKGALTGCVPSWGEFSPLASEQAPTPTPDPAVVSEVTEELERFDEAEEKFVSLGNVTFVCTDKTYSFTENPSQALSFNMDETVIWPGALIQGRSHRDAANTGGLLELPIRERAPINVTVTFNNDDNSRLVDSPDNGSVSSALGSMILGAELQGLATANNIDFKQEVFSSEKQAAVAFGVSGRYLGFEASAQGSTTSSVSTNVVAAQFKQQMYVAGVTQPSTPQAFFSDAFTDEAYQAQETLGRIGPANPPLYVARVGYGRMMVFTMSAKAEASEIKGALEVAYNGVGGSAQANLSAKQTAILNSAELRISQVGGDQQNALNAISTGKLEDYFSDTAPLTSAAPLWFELKSLTGEVAVVSEPGTYTETTCVPKLPGTFDYQDEQSMTIPFTPGTQRTTLQADVNGDGRMDLVFNERRTSPALNRTHVALASGAGMFTLQSAFDHSETPAEGWENFNVHVADLDGDGRDDLVWNALTASNNVNYLAMSTGDGLYTERPRQERPAGGWNTYRAVVGDLNGDGRDDLLWTNAGSTNTTTLRTYFGIAKSDSTLATPLYVDRAGNFSGYQNVALAQMDGAGGVDLVLNALGNLYNNTYVGRFTATSDTTGTLSFPPAYVDPVDGWATYRFRVGNIDGQPGADLAWASPEGRVYRHLNSGNGSFGTRPPFYDSNFANTSMHLADFNNDGRQDILLVNQTAGDNQLLTGFGLADGNFTYPAGVQTHPEVPVSGWLPYSDIFVGDVNADGKADIVWTNPSGDARIYVALAK